MGYGYFNAHYNGRKSVQKATRASLRIFRAEERPPTTYACHKCDNPACVNPDHLFWGSAKQNSQDMVAKGRAAMPQAILDAETVLRVVDRLCESVSLKAIAKEFDVAETTVKGVLYRHHWHSVISLESAAKMRAARPDRRRKLQAENIPAIDASFANGEPAAQIGARFGVNRKTIEDVVHRKRWAWIPILPEHARRLAPLAPRAQPVLPGLKEL